MRSLGAKLRDLRVEGGHTVREFADFVGKSPGYISRIEGRGEIPSAELLCVIAEVYEIDAQELLELAKRNQLHRIEREIKSKQESALALHRKAKRES